MKNLVKRGLSLLLALVIYLSLLPVMRTPASAATVEYVYGDGNVIKNWGVRGELATFLSPNAEAFYTGENTYEDFAALDGSTDTSTVPDSELYAALHTFMEGEHHTITSYDGTKDLYQYTDCQNSGKDGVQISAFYSGTFIGPSWDSTPAWTREHTWPNSKGLGGSDENDIMMLRPAAGSTNSSRGNKAYGESAGYYDPNSVSNGTYNLRGDVARIMLYVYVRWGNTENMWGAEGVIESVDVLLDWMEEDPVDTWELGRNDSVESITGTRNVFVDYPELAFQLFGEDVPTAYDTPSGNAAASTYSVTATVNNADYGRVITNGKYVFAMPEDGYYAVDCTLTNGGATVSRNANVFSVAASSACTVQVNFAPRASVSATFRQDGIKLSDQIVYNGYSFALPDGADLEGYTFIGWVTGEVAETEVAPEDIYEAGAWFTAGTENITFHALYSYAVEDTDSAGTVYKLVTDVNQLVTDTNIVIAAADYDFAMSTNQKTNNRGVTAITKTGDVISWSGDEVAVLVLKAGTIAGTYSFYTGSGYLYAASGSKNYLKTQTTQNDNASFAITVSGSVSSIVAQGTNTRNTMQYNLNNGSPLIACYASASQKPLALYIETASESVYTTYYGTDIDLGTLDTTGDLALESVNLTLASSQYINFNGFKDNLDSYSDLYVIFEAEGKEPVVVDEYFTHTDKDGNIRYNFSYQDLSILDFNLEVYATLYGTKDGVLYRAEPVSYSLLKFCTTALMDDNSGDQVPCANLLKYAIAAEAYKDIPEADRIETILTDEQATRMNELAAESSEVNVASNSVLSQDGATVKFVSQSLDMYAQVALLYKISFASYEGDPNDVSFEVKYTDVYGTEQVEEYTFDDLIATSNEDIYMLSFSKFYSTQMREEATCTIYVAGEVHASYQNSIEHYCYTAINNPNETELMKELARRISLYGDSANEAYGS